jgi:putative transposase
MSKEPRLLLSKSYYHVTTRGNNRNVVFKEKEDYLYYLNLIKKYKKEHPFDIYHYCLMSNHTHFLIRIGNAFGFSVFMKKINLAYYYYFKKKYGWTGHLWQGRYNSQSVGKDEYFLQCGKYIELNPVRANIVKDPGDYSYSSYNYYAKGKEDEIVTEDFFYENFGNNKKERQDKYREILIDEIIEKSYSKYIWGSDIQRHREKRKIKRRIN